VVKEIIDHENGSMKLMFFKIHLKSFKLMKQITAQVSQQFNGRRSIIDREFDPGNNRYKLIWFHIGRLRT
jgi:hypothetical protein